MSNKSIDTRNTLTNLRDKEQDTIPFRIDFIRNLLNKGELKPLVNFDNTDTENFVNKINNNYNDSESDKTHDTRAILNKKVHDFNSIISQIGGNLLYIKSGSTGHTFKGIMDVNNQDEENNYAVKVVAYPKKEKYGNIYDSRRPENAELMMIKLLSYFVVKNQTPHIVLPIGTFNTSIKPFVSLIKDNVIDEDNKKYQEFVDRFKSGEYHDEVSILISEWANRGDFLDFIRKYHKNFQLLHWKVFFFQFLSVLAVIQSKFPSFRHNDLKANNILVNKIYKKNPRFTYKVVKNTYLVPNIGYQLKLWDFDFACIPGVVDNSKVAAEWTKSINVIPEQNRYYDMHYFFNTLIKKGFFPQFLDEKIVPKEAIEFVNRVVPKKYQEGKYTHKRGRILIKDEYLTPNDVLMNDPFFEEFRIKNKDYKNKDNNDNRDKLRQEDKKKNIVEEPIKKLTREDKKENLRTIKSPPKSNKATKKYDFDLVNLDDLLMMNSDSS